MPSLSQGDRRIFHIYIIKTIRLLSVCLQRETTVAFRYEPYGVAQPTSPLCLGLMVQLLGGGVINQTSLDVVLMLLSPVAHCEAS